MIFRFVFLFFLTTSLWAKETDVVDAVQISWDKIATYQAGFKQVVFSKRLRTEDQSTGLVFIKKPGKLRWEAKSENETQILNGKKLWYLHENRRRKTLVVDVYRDISKQMDNRSLAFLAGKVNLKKSYDIEVLPEKSGVVTLKLKPKGDEGESYLAEIAKPGYILRALTTETPDSRVRIELSDVKTGVLLEESLFQYQPKPTDVVHEN